MEPMGVKRKLAVILTAAIAPALAGCEGGPPAVSLEEAKQITATYQAGAAAYRLGDYATALQEFKPLAERGNADAQYRLGVMYAKGQGVARNYAEAFKWYTKAAEQGLADAQYRLGVIHSSHRPRDYAKAAKWYRKAAEQGHAEAEFRLGRMYEEELGVPQDHAEAAKWYRKAAEQGFARAQRYLGDMYEKGQGVPQDYAEAVKWYRKAAEQGFAGAQLRLGVMYFSGRGVPQDSVQAYMWVDLAVSRFAPGYVRDTIAGGVRKTVAAKMTPAQIAEAQRLAREWTEKHGKK